MDGDGNGNYVVTWRDNRNGIDFDIFAQIFLSDSTPLSNNFVVNDDEGTATQYGPAVAVDANLNFVITWLDRRNGWEWDVYAQRFSNDGTALGGNFKVNDEPGNEEQEDATVSIDSCGNFVIVWTDEKSGDWDIYGQRYLADGTALGGNFKINDDTGTELQYWPTSKGAKNGDFIVSWVDKRNTDDYDIYAQRFLADGTAQGNNFKVNVDMGDVFQIHPNIIIMENGNFIIAWADERNGDWDIYAQRYLDDGTTVGDNFKIYDDSPDANQYSPFITTDLAGNFTVCWTDDRNEHQDIYAQRFASDATPLGSNFLVNNDTVNANQLDSKISADDNGNFMIIWKDQRFGFNGEIFAQSFLDDGTPVGDNFKVNDDKGSANQIGPSIAVDGSDNFIVAWVDSRNFYTDIFFQRFSSDGTTLGGNVIINDDTARYTMYNGPSVSADDAGNFVVAWDDYRYEYWGEIYAQRFSSDGIALGSNFKVNNLSYPVVYGATVVCKKNGDFIVVWGDSRDESKDTLHWRHQHENNFSEPDIWFQQYLSDGTTMGINVKVNDDAGNTDQTNPSIAIDTSGNFIIIWQDNRNGNWDIYAQRYLCDGTPLDSNIMLVDTVVITYARRPSISSDENGNFIIAWNDNRNGNYDIWARRYLSDCSPLGNIFQVNDDSGTANQFTPCVSADGDGKFIITWNDMRNGNHDVYAQRYMSNGQPIGNNYRITNTEDMRQMRPSVILDNDRIYSAWQDNRGGQTGWDIWANVFEWGSWVGLDEKLNVEIPSDICLHQNYPNPFKDQTTISYYLTEQSMVSIKVFDMTGRVVEELLNESSNPGNHQVVFDAENLHSGIYYYQLQADENILSRKMMILK